MTSITTKSESLETVTDTAIHLFDNWFDPIESGVRERVRQFIEALICSWTGRWLARAMGGQRRRTVVRKVWLATGTAAARGR